MTLEQLQKKYPKATLEENGKDGYSHTSPGEPDRGRWVVARFDLDEGGEAILAEDWIHNKTNVVSAVIVINPR